MSEAESGKEYQEDSPFHAPSRRACGPAFAVGVGVRTVLTDVIASQRAGLACASLIDKDQIAIVPEAFEISLAHRSHGLRCRSTRTALEPEHRIRLAGGSKAGSTMIFRLIFRPVPADRFS